MRFHKDGGPRGPPLFLRVPEPRFPSPEADLEFLTQKHHCPPPPRRTRSPPTHLPGNRGRVQEGGRGDDPAPSGSALPACPPAIPDGRRCEPHLVCKILGRAHQVVLPHGCCGRGGRRGGSAPGSPRSSLARPLPPLPQTPPPPLLRGCERRTGSGRAAALSSPLPRRPVLKEQSRPRRPRLAAHSPAHPAPGPGAQQGGRVRGWRRPARPQAVNWAAGTARAEPGLDTFAARAPRPGGARWVASETKGGRLQGRPLPRPSPALPGAPAKAPATSAAAAAEAPRGAPSPPAERSGPGPPSGPGVLP